MLHSLQISRNIFALIKRHFKSSCKSNIGSTYRKPTKHLLRRLLQPALARGDTFLEPTLYSRRVERFSGVREYSDWLATFLENNRTVPPTLKNNSNCHTIKTITSLRELLYYWAWLFESRLTLIHDQNCTEVTILFAKIFLKTNFKLMVKKRLSQN